MIPFRMLDGIEPIFIGSAWIVFFIYTWFSLRKSRSSISIKNYILFFLVLLFFATAGGRVWYFSRFIYSGEFDKALYMFSPFQGGLVSFGMIFGGVVGLIIGVKLFFMKKGEPLMASFSKLADIIAPGMALYIFVFRIGCLLDGHVRGTKTSLPWALQYYGESFGRHPVAAYLSLSALLLFFLLKLFFSRKKPLLKKRFDGEPALWFFLFYCFNRFWIEFLARGHIKKVDPRYLGLLKPQWTCLIFFILTSIYLILAYRLYRKSIKKHARPLKRKKKHR